MTSLSEKQLLLDQAVVHTISKYPKLFDRILSKGLYQLLANADNDFFEVRSFAHLQRFLLRHFFLQKRMEQILASSKHDSRKVLIQIFTVSSRICIAIMFSYRRQSEIFNEQHILKAVQTFVPGIKEIPDSFLTWQSIKHSYLFCYLEVQKPRGKNLSSKEIRQLQNDLQKQVLHGVTICCPSVFWPYNYEESYRQLLLLQKEVQSVDDLPQISIHFKGQTPLDLEFLVYMVRPESNQTLEKNSEKLPPFIRFVTHNQSKFNGSFPSEAYAFSLHVPTCCLDVSPTVNLLNARKYVAMLLEGILGSFRDFNGGLFIQQEDLFGKFKRTWMDKIPDFSLFGEALFYSLKPLESQITLKMQQAELLFRTFSSVMEEKSSFFFHHSPEGVLVLKTKDVFFLEPLIQKVNKLKNVVYASLQLADMHYFVFLDPTNTYAAEIARGLLAPTEPIDRKILRLAFQDGLPLSLNPHHTSDIRCGTVYKALFEGLTRLDESGNAVLAGAERIECSADGKTYTAFLRPNRWSNGEKVTSFQYAENWRQLQATKPREEIFKTVQAKDSNTLEIQLEYPDPIFLKKLSQPQFFPAYDSRKEPQVFNGPYFAYFQNEKSLILKLNPHFWDSEQIQLDTIEISYIPDPGQLSDLYIKKSIDWIGSPFSTIPEEITLDLEKQQFLSKNISSLVFWLHLNTTFPPLQSRSIRQALSLSLNRGEIHREILDDQPHFTPLPPSYSLTSRLFFQNSNRAKELFGQGLKELRLTRETFPQLELRCFNHPRIAALSKYLQQYWGELFGIQIAVECTDWNTFRSALEKGNYQIGGCYEAPSYPDPLTFLERLDPSNPMNFSQWTNPAFQEKLTLAKSSKGQPERNRWLKQAEDLIVEEVPIIPISHAIQYYSHRSELIGSVFDHTGSVDFRWTCFKV